jgi:hypothetical protein
MSPEPLDYQPVPDHEPRHRFALRVASVFIGMYCLAVVVMALAKLTVNPRMLQWNEVFEGPAITLGCCLVLFAVAAGARARRGRRKP